MISDSPPGLVQLCLHAFAKPWGRTDVAMAADTPVEGDGALGEIWFKDPADSDPELLVKHLFTSERLSIQVHPDDAGARARGYARGKDEAWFILSAEPGASIALGPDRPMTEQQLRAAALDGSIEKLMHWRPVQAGDFIYSPAGTIHAIGAGLILIEVQQNLDLTYRLYDYGRDRELHLAESLAAADRTPFIERSPPKSSADREILVCGAAFVVERWRAPFQGRIGPARNGAPLLIPLRSGGRAGAVELRPNSVWKLSGAADLELRDEADLLVAYPGAGVEAELRA